MFIAFKVLCKTDIQIQLAELKQYGMLTRRKDLTFSNQKLNYGQKDLYKVRKHKITH